MEQPVDFEKLVAKLISLPTQEIGTEEIPVNKVLEYSFKAIVELVEEAKHRYPVGTRFRVAHYPDVELPETVLSHDVHKFLVVVSDMVHINFLVESGGSASVYAGGKWATILEGGSNLKGTKNKYS